MGGELTSKQGRTKRRSGEEAERRPRGGREEAESSAGKKRKTEKTEAQKEKQKSDDHPEFQPNMSPKEVLQAGSFGGTYFRPIYSSITSFMKVVVRKTTCGRSADGPTVPVSKVVGEITSLPRWCGLAKGLMTPVCRRWSGRPSSTGGTDSLRRITDKERKGSNPSKTNRRHSVCFTCNCTVSPFNLALSGRFSF